MAYQNFYLLNQIRGGTPDSGNLVFEWYAETEALSNGASVPQLTDTSGHSDHATQATAGSRGTYTTNDVGGKASVNFDGGNDYYQLTSDVVGTGDWTIYAVWRTPVGASQDSSITGGGSTGINYQQWTGDMQLRLASTALYQSSGQFLSKNTWYQSNTSYAFGTSTWDFRANKVQGNTGTAAHGSWSPGVRYIGTFNGSSRFWQGKMAAVLIYSAAHNTTTKQSVEAFLSTYFAGAV